MEFTINSDILNDALKKVEKGIDKKCIAPVLENVLIEVENDNLILTSSNIKNTIKIKLENKAENLEEGKITIQKDTIKILSKLKRQNLEFNDNSIIAGKRTINFKTNIGENFPKINNSFEFKTVLKNPLELFKMKYATLKNGARPVLNSIMLDGQSLVTTDTHRLAIRKLHLDTELENVLIDISTIELLCKVLDKNTEFVNVYLDDLKSEILFENDNMQVIGKLNDGEFLNYKQVIPSDCNTTIKVERKKMLQELQFMEIVAKNSEGMFTFGIIDYKLDIFASDTNNNLETSIDILENDNTDFRTAMSFNIKCFIDTLKNFKDDIVEISIDRKVSPIKIIENDGKNIDILLPMRNTNLENIEYDKYTKKI